MRALLHFALVRLRQRALIFGVVAIAAIGVAILPANAASVRFCNWLFQDASEFYIGDDDIYVMVTDLNVPPGTSSVSAQVVDYQGTGDTVAFLLYTTETPGEFVGPALYGQDLAGLRTDTLTPIPDDEYLQVSPDTHQIKARYNAGSEQDPNWSEAIALITLRDYTWPLTGARKVSSNFGAWQEGIPDCFHEGLDLPGGAGEDVVAIQSGRRVPSAPSSVVIESWSHFLGDPLRVGFYHTEPRPDVPVAARVRWGQTVATIKHWQEVNTSFTHVHFLTAGAQYYNPLLFYDWDDPGGNLPSFGPAFYCRHRDSSEARVEPDYRWRATDGSDYKGWRPEDTSRIPILAGTGDVDLMSEITDDMGGIIDYPKPLGQENLFWGVTCVPRGVYFWVESLSGGSAACLKKTIDPLDPWFKVVEYNAPYSIGGFDNNWFYEHHVLKVQGGEPGAQPVPYSYSFILTNSLELAGGDHPNRWQLGKKNGQQYQYPNDEYRLHVQAQDDGYRMTDHSYVVYVDHEMKTAPSLVLGPPAP